MPSLHAEVQDTACDAWHIVSDGITLAIDRGDTLFEPLAGLTSAQRQQIITLPASIGQMKDVTELRLYGSHLVRLPPEIGGMSSLQYLDVYTSYCLHFFPYEITRCRQLKRSRVSTRALYGNYKHRPPFPHLRLHKNQEALARLTPPTCSVCGGPLGEAGPQWRWLTLRVGTDCMPLLVAACSAACIEALPTAPADYVQTAHIGGRHIVQPPVE
ncbi:MAG: leucine-rich repeat domain-containing protein [Polyangiaceae bacterium]|nr:leucine-rich repeat domain-containing protein [Polyangiaceae bacterium]